MATKKLLSEVYAVYQEIFDRIQRHIDRFAYATYSYVNLDNWTFDDEHTIIINTSDTCFIITSISIESKYLETDDAFEDWIDVRYNERKVTDEEKARKEAKRKEDYERRMYDKLKNKFE